MAKWQFIDANGRPLNVPIYDDGTSGGVGDPGFGTDQVTLQMALVPGTHGFNYVGQSQG